ncbi:MAG: hypothetical protein CMJ31_11040, partial [Phycisphaerae bacterium]|nr:hypothetical protein [Phycisphaerae bacterium]
MLRFDPVSGAPAPVVPIAVWFSVSLVACGAALVAPRSVRRVSVLTAVGAIAAGYTLARLTPSGVDGVFAEVAFDPAPGASPRLVSVEGRIARSIPAREIAAGSPERWLFAKPAPTFVVRVDRLLPSGGEPIGLRGETLVIGVDLSERYGVGERVRLTGMLGAVGFPMNPGEVDPRLWAAQDRRLGPLRVGDLSSVEGVEASGVVDAARGAWLRFREGRRRAIRSLIGAATTSTERSQVVEALLLGANTRDASAVRERFTDAGVSHLMAISGFHVAALLGVALLAVRLTGDRPRLEAVVTVALLVAIVVVVPLRAPILRSVLLYAALVAPGVAGRRYDPLATLGWVACALLAWRPLELFTLGFQLSVGVTAALVWLGVSAHPWITPRERFDGAAPSVLDRLLGATGRAAVVCVVCWLVAAPLIALHVGRVQPLAPLAALVATPVVALTLVFGYASAFAGLVSSAIGSVLGAAAGGAAEVSLWVMALFSGGGRGVDTPPISIAWAVASSLAVVWLLRARTVRRAGPWVAIAACVAWLVVEARVAPGGASDVGMRVDALSGGGGSCLVGRAG